MYLLLNIFQIHFMYLNIHFPPCIDFVNVISLASSYILKCFHLCCFIGSNPFDLDCSYPFNYFGLCFSLSDLLFFTFDSFLVLKFHFLTNFQLNESYLFQFLIKFVLMSKFIQVFLLSFLNNPFNL